MNSSQSEPRPPDDVAPESSMGAHQSGDAGPRRTPRWPARTILRSARAFTRVELFDRSMTVAAQLFTSLFPLLILLATWATRRDADRIADAVSMPEQSRKTLEDAVTAAGNTAFGVVGLLVVLVSATGVSRALTRAFAMIWELPRPKSNPLSLWRWVAAVLGLVASLLAVRGLGRLVEGVPPTGAWSAVVVFLCDVGISLFVPWVLLAGVVRARLLVPGALIAAGVNLAVRPATLAWFPNALEESADRYGSIGVAFTYLAMLYSVALGFLATAIVGQVIATDPGRLGQWIRGTVDDTSSLDALIGTDPPGHDLPEPLGPLEGPSTARAPYHSCSTRWGLNARRTVPTLRVMSTEGSTNAAPTSDAIDDLLLETKLSVPLARPQSVSRAPLIEAARDSSCRVVDVTAPAGYGKSTLLAQWANSESRPVAWVSLDRFDDDPLVLLGLLAAAFARIAPEQADLVSDLGGPGISPLGRAAPRLAAVLGSSPVPFVLMLDDLHEVRSPDCHDVLGVVISGIPDGSQLVAASRSEQPHAPRLRASGDVLELGSDDLALDADDAVEIFAEAAVELTPDLAAAVTRETEGWAVGLQLAAAIAHESNGKVLTVRGDDRYVADYLYHEVTANLPATTQRFLRCTSVLDQLSASLCDAVLEAPGSQQVLQQLEATSALLIPLDRRRQWYRFHPLFREFLASELLRVEPDAVEKLHLRAADWYEANGSTPKAMEHLLKTSARGRTVQMVTALVLPTYQAGQISTVRQWLDAIGDRDISRHPPLAVLAGWICMFSGGPVEAQHWAAIANEASYDLVPADGSASFASARAMLRAAMCASGPEAMQSDAALALSEEPSWSPWRDTALCVGAEALLLVGEPEQAAAMFRETSSVAATLSNIDSFILSEAELALLDMDGGLWVGAADHVDRALAAVDQARMEDYALSALAFAAAARHAMHRGDAEEARRHLTRAMRSRPTCTVVLPWLAVRLRLQVAMAYEALGERRTVHHLLREIDDLFLAGADLGVLGEQVRNFRSHLEPGTEGRVAGTSPLSPAELRLLPYLQTHLTIREIGERLFVSRNTVSSEIGSIYRKLGVSSRGQAVSHATAIGLLGG